MYFNHNFRSCFCQEKAALWIILSVFLWMLTFKATEMKAALQRRSVQDFPVNDRSVKDQNKKTPQRRLWYPLPGRSSFVPHLQGCQKGKLATSFWGSLVAMLGDQLLSFVSAALLHSAGLHQGVGEFNPAQQYYFLCYVFVGFSPGVQQFEGQKGCAVLWSVFCSWLQSSVRQSNHTLIYRYVTVPLTICETVRGFPVIYLISRSAIYWDTCSVQNPIHYY